MTVKPIWYTNLFKCMNTAFQAPILLLDRFLTTEGGRLALEVPRDCHAESKILGNKETKIDIVFYNILPLERILFKKILCSFLHSPVCV